MMLFYGTQAFCIGAFDKPCVVCRMPFEYLGIICCLFNHLCALEVGNLFSFFSFLSFEVRFLFKESTAS